MNDKDAFEAHDRDFIPAMAFCDPEILDDPRVRKVPGTPVWEVDVDGETFRVVAIPAGMYGGLGAGYAVFGSDGYWLGDKELRPTDRVAAQWVYPTAIQAVTMVLTKPAWVD